MGHPRRLRKRFSKPLHPWQKGRIEEEKLIIKEYGFKNKKEIWKMSSVLGKFKEQSKKLISTTTNQAEREKQQLLKKLISLGLLKTNSRIEDALSISLQDLLKRRLQTIVYKKNLARTISQARQFIVHEHMSIGDKTITSPSYLVTIDEEPLINFNSYSRFSDPEHPERKIEVKEPKKPKKKESRNTRT